MLVLELERLIRWKLDIKAWVMPETPTEQVEDADRSGGLTR